MVKQNNLPKDPNKPRNLTERQRLFVKYYIDPVNNYNIAECARKAGFSEGATKNSSRIYASPTVAAEIRRHFDKVEEKSSITLEWKLRKLKQIIDNSSDDNVIIKAIAELNKMQGSYAPIRQENTNLHAFVITEIKDLITQYEKEY